MVGGVKQVRSRKSKAKSNIILPDPVKPEAAIERCFKPKPCNLLGGGGLCSGSKEWKGSGDNKKAVPVRITCVTKCPQGRKLAEDGLVWLDKGNGDGKK